MQLVSLILIRSIVIYSVDSTIQLLSNWGQINLYPLDNTTLVSLILIWWIVIYLVDSAIQLLNYWGLVNSSIHCLNNWSKCNVQFTVNIPLQSFHFLTFFFFIICSFFLDGVQV